MSVVALENEPTRRNRRLLRASNTRRRIGAAALVVAGLFVLLNEEAARLLEVTICSALIGAFVPGGTRVWTDHVVFRAQSGTYDVALRITTECASYVFLLPFLGFVAAILAFTRVPLRRWFIGAAVGGLGIYLCNQIRIWMIAFSTHTWGMNPGYDISHGLVGSAFAICGAVAFVLVTMMIMFRKPRRP